MWTRRQVLAQFGIAAAAIHTLDPHEICCGVDAHAATQEKNLFELKKVADGVYAAFAGPASKVNSNAAVILTNDGAIVVDTHSKPSAAAALYTEIQGVTKNPVNSLRSTRPGCRSTGPAAIATGSMSTSSTSTRRSSSRPEACRLRAGARPARRRLPLRRPGRLFGRRTPTPSASCPQSERSASTG